MMTKAERLHKIVADIARALSPWVEDGRTGQVRFEVSISQGTVRNPVVETREALN